MANKDSSAQPPPDQPPDLPAWIWALLPLATIAVAAMALWIEPGWFEKMLAKDKDGGWVELGTFLVLLPGIAASLVALIRHRRRLPKRWLAWWFAIWVAACIYFAGEEISWGQHFFHWATPRLFENINVQKETGFHNTSTWLNEKPRTMVEMWIVLGGLVLPLSKSRWYRPRQPLPMLDTTARPAAWPAWFWPSHVGIIAAAMTLITRGMEELGSAIESNRLTRLGSSEVREFYVALFLSLYLLSFWWRLKEQKVSSFKCEGSSESKVDRVSGP